MNIVKVLGVVVGSHGVASLVIAQPGCRSTAVKPAPEPAPQPAHAVAYGEPAAAVSAVPPLVSLNLPLPAVPEAVTQSVTTIEAWKSTGGQLWTFGAWLTAHPMQGVALVLCVAAIWFGPSLLQRKA